MKNMLLGTVGLLLLVLFVSVFYQYRVEITRARERVVQGSNILSTDDGEIEYAVRGEGMPVLLLHGAGGGYDQGLFLGETALGEGFTFISVSRFGYLRSPFLGDSTVEKQAALYAALLDHLGIDEVIIAAGSAGGPSALQFAHDYPERSKALILVSAVSMFMGDEIPATTRVVNTIQKSDFAYWLVVKLFRYQLMEMIGIPRDAYDSFSSQEKVFTDKMMELMHPMSPRRPGNIHEAQIRPLTAEAMGEIAIPTIILHAKNDTLVTYDHAVFAHDNIQQSELVSFESGGHGLIAKYKEIRQHIGSFLDRNL